MKHSHNQWNAGTQIHSSIWCAIEISKLLASRRISRSNVALALAHQPCTGSLCCIARCGLTRGFLVLCKVRIIPSDIKKTGNFPAALGIFELLHLLSCTLQAPLLLFPVCPSHSQWGSHKPAQSQCCLSKPSQELGSWCVEPAAYHAD